MNFALFFSFFPPFLYTFKTDDRERKKKVGRFIIQFRDCGIEDGYVGVTKVIE